MFASASGPLEQALSCDGVISCTATWRAGLPSTVLPTGRRANCPRGVLHSEITCPLVCLYCTNIVIISALQWPLFCIPDTGGLSHLTVWRVFSRLQWWRTCADTLWSRLIDDRQQAKKLENEPNKATTLKEAVLWWWGNRPSTVKTKHACEA